ncbi:MAG: type ISP restriction/modification enzyme [Deinococcales bacterium]
MKSQRDEWVYDFSKDNLAEKMRYFVVTSIKKTLENEHFTEKLSIKWDRELDKYRVRNIVKKFQISSIHEALYRPFSKMYFYFDRHFNGMVYQWEEIYHPQKQNTYISLVAIGATSLFTVLLVKISSIFTQLHSQCPFINS